MARPISILDITAEEEEELRRRVAASTTSVRDHLRASIILRRIDGVKQVRVAEELGVSVACVNKWSQRFEREGLEGLSDREGRGRKPSIPIEPTHKLLLAAGADCILELAAMFCAQ